MSLRRLANRSLDNSTRDGSSMLIEMEVSGDHSQEDTAPLLSSSGKQSCYPFRRKLNNAPRRINFYGGERPLVLPEGNYPANVVRNQKYSVITFIPLVLYRQYDSPCVLIPLTFE